MSCKDTVISVRNMTKTYRLLLAEKQTTLAEAAIARMKNPFKRTPSETFHALNDLSFEVKRGDVIGIIGRNGAGKSTLLKILSRITEPTSGEADIYGRVGSLLEVGTGFHPELTGRENVYLNGAILGMKKGEIDRQFDAIVDFAEISKFLDTPVKRYSSGMYVRLAFAVAAHLNPEILIVDEVLAVGDAQFQAKCLGKMKDVSQGQGRTVLFVSHNMAAVHGLCTRGIYLERGHVAVDGTPFDAIERYTRGAVNPSRDLRNVVARVGCGGVKFTSVDFTDGNGVSVPAAATGQPFVVALDYSSGQARDFRGCRVSVLFANEMGQPLILCSSELTNPELAVIPSQGRICCRLPQFPLTTSRYLLSFFIEANGEVQDYLENALVLEVVDGDFYGTGKLFPNGWQGKSVMVPHSWELDTSYAAVTAGAG